MTRASARPGFSLVAPIFIRMSRFFRKPVRGHDHGHVVPPAGVERPLHESFARIAGPGRLHQNAGDRLVVNEVGQAIAAEQQAIAILELQPIGVHVNRLGGSAERVRQHVTMARAGDVAGGELAHVDQQLRKRVISGEAMQTSGAEQVDP